MVGHRLAEQRLCFGVSTFQQQDFSQRRHNICGVWILQGSGVMPGSFMTGQRMWLVIGIIVAIVGLALAYNGIRRPARP